MTYWLNDDSRTFLSRGYLTEGQTAEQRIRHIAETAERILDKPGFADKFERYVLNGWISMSSPIWANFGTERGLPISCNNSFFEDSVESILMKTAEIGMMSKLGAGTSAYLGKIRPRGSAISGGGVADGPVHYMAAIETTVDIISQSNVRRGSCAVYLDVEHPDIWEFLTAREEGSAIQNLSLGVCVSDDWLNSMVAGDPDKRRLWTRIIQKRFESGYPYVFFTDNANRRAPDVYQDLGRKIHGSNLCSEIMLSSTHDESFVCNLSSLNLLHFDQWQSTDVVRTLVYFLDAVMTEYIEKTERYPLMQAARNFAIRQRALGIGVLGWHSYLQSNMIPFESMAARLHNARIFRHIKSEADAASRIMVLEGYEEPEMLRGYGRRHVTLMAVAPTTSSSFILGQVSPSIEPENSNYFVKDLQKGKFTYKNPYLVRLLQEKGQDSPETWRSILLKGGSVQHLDFLSEDEKAVFKTFGEISQGEIVSQAAQRQPFIDQGQSLNVTIHPDTPLKEVNQLMLDAWRNGVKALYYQRSTNPAQELVRSLVSCAVCEA